MEKERNPRAAKRPRKKVCMFCADRVEKIDYKDLAKLRKCMTDRAKILPRRVTGTCAYHQRELTLLSREQDTLLYFHTLVSN
jgi:small subunit ribosomal protein S18